MFDEVLANALGELEGGRCVILTGSDGVVVASAVATDGPAPDIVAASLADLFRKAGVAHRDAGFEPPRELMSRASSGQSVLRAVTPEYLLVAVLDGIAGLGRTRFVLRKAAAALESQLN